MTMSAVFTKHLCNNREMDVFVALTHLQVLMQQQPKMTTRQMIQLIANNAASERLEKGECGLCSDGSIVGFPEKDIGYLLMEISDNEEEFMELLGKETTSLT